MIFCLMLKISIATFVSFSDIRETLFKSVISCKINPVD